MWIIFQLPNAVSIEAPWFVTLASAISCGFGPLDGRPCAFGPEFSIDLKPYLRICWGAPFVDKTRHKTAMNYDKKK